MTYSLRNKIGAAIIDAPLYASKLLPISKRNAWQEIRNRDEQLKWAPQRQGALCNWRWTSDLHLPKVFPFFGGWLFNRAFNDFPVRFAQQPANIDSETPKITFIIGHRGMDRAPLLMKTIESIAGQQNCGVACLIVEQDVKPLIRDQLPEWVDHLFIPLPNKDTPYSRSMAFNEGVKVINTDYFVLHDNDMVAPNAYASELLKIFESGYEFIDLKRFIFYLSEPSSQEYLSNDGVMQRPIFDSVMQNNQGGASMGAEKQAFLQIGGFDERFIGWGGEDNELWDRAETRRVWSYCNLPFIHLWHPSQPEKVTFSGAKEESMYNRLSKQTPHQRIERLLKL